MTMENSGHEETNSPAGKDLPPAAAAVPNPSRRRFTRAGVGASAVVMTLASRSVLADTLCKSPSGFDSLSPSMTTADKQTVCAGKTASQWMMQDPWPIDKETPFASIFGNGYGDLYAGASLATSASLSATTSSTGGKKWFDTFSDNPNKNNGDSDNKGNSDGKVKPNNNADLHLKDATLFQAISGTRTPPLVKSLIAAWLNARGKYSSFPTETNVVQIFQEWHKNGYYEVRATVKWYEADIIKYLASTNAVG
jgi:hypothetical protein